MIDSFVRGFASHLVATTDEKEEWCAELAAHLEEAREMGDLDGALERLGSPREAAAAFRAARPLAPASLNHRWAAQVVDHVPLLILIVLLGVQQIGSGHVIQLGFPPGLVITSDRSLLWNLGVSLVLLWSWAGLALIEAASGGRTPGKALFGLRAVSEGGTTISCGEAIGRRWSILFGPLAWIDWAAVFFTGRRQRLLDLLAHTMVVADPDRVRAAVPARGSAEPRQ